MGAMSEVSPAVACLTIGEYRLTVLRCRQNDVALRAQCKQSWVSQIESGHLPKPWNRKAILRAYGLERWEADFERMVTNAKKMNALAKPIAETEPLLATGQAEKRAEVSGLVPAAEVRSA